MAWAVRRGTTYLAGDSFTWGYVPFEMHFGTLLERGVNRRVLKCGVNHTGQSHQLEKFEAVLAITGRLPALVVVNYYANDIANDFAHPHTTVIEGWQIDDVGLIPPEQLISLDPEMLKRKIQEKLDSQAQDSRSAGQWLSRPSISYHLFLRLTGQRQNRKKKVDPPA